MDLPESFTKLLDKFTPRQFFGLGALIGSVLILGGAFFLNNESTKNLKASLASAKATEIGAFPIAVPHVKYGFALDTFQQVSTATIETGQFLADILMGHGLEYADIDQLVRNAIDVFDVRHLRVGKPFTLLTRDTSQGPDHLVYEPSVYEYVVFDLKGDLKVHRHKRPVTRELRKSGGAIESSLWNAMVDNGMSFDLTARMEDALQWSIDFHHIQKGDQFKLVYDQEFIDGKQVGVGQVYAAYYKNYDNEFHAIYFDNGEHQGYYDLEGRPMKKFFLKSPVKYSRISSYYNLNRFHPILKRRRPHLGTDYAAPYGTPIYAVGDGVVVAASYTNGNGNFVKIKHDDTYQTQYLHMRSFAKGIRAGVHVKQGQVIGYVGSTGLATGPHVCFRFWKNGRQINHLRLSFPPPEPLPEEDLPAFYEVRDRYLEMLSGICFSNTDDNDTDTLQKRM